MKLVFIVYLLFCKSIGNINAEEIHHKLYGYSQLDYKSSNDPNLDDGFNLTRINLINEFSIDDNARFVADIEFEDGANMSSTATSMGSIKMSRGFFEYNFLNDTSISAGKLLTPFGLLNETHDFTITYLPIEVPLPYRPFIPLSGNKSTRVFAKYATGLSLKKNSKIFDKYILTNQITLSNGFSEKNSGADSNHDKAYSLKSTLKLFQGENSYEEGISIYTEQDSTVFEGSYKKRFWTTSVHFKFENNSINFATEVIYSKFNSGTKENQEALAYYACLGINLNEKFTPYLLYSKALRDISNKQNYDNDKIIGINYNWLEKAILKFEITQTEREVLSVSRNYKTIATDLAIAF